MADLGQLWVKEYISIPTQDTDGKGNNKKTMVHTQEQLR